MIDPQLKRGLLDVCVLSLLRRGDSYGYQIIKDLSGCIEISESTLYPILRRLETVGCLTVYSVEHSGRLHRGTQRQAAEILPHHPRGRGGHRPVLSQLAGDPTGISVDKGVCRR